MEDWEISSPFFVAKLVSKIWWQIGFWKSDDRLRWIYTETIEDTRVWDLNILHYDPQKSGQSY